MYKQNFEIYGTPKKKFVYLADYANKNILSAGRLVILQFELAKLRNEIISASSHNS